MVVNFVNMVKNFFDKFCVSDDNICGYVIDRWINFDIVFLLLSWCVWGIWVYIGWGFIVR